MASIASVSRLNRRTHVRRRLLASALALFALACGDSSVGGGTCTPLAAADFGCADPADCLAMIATWNFPGSDSQGNANLDLILTIDDGMNLEVIDSDDTTPRLGCVHSGDMAATDELEETSEFIRCDPPQVDGDYLFRWQALITLPVRIDTLDDGAITCAIENNTGTEEFVRP